MKKFVLAVVAATGLLALTGAAQAKEIGSLKVCGASGCNTLSDRAQLGGMAPEGYTDSTQAAGQRYYSAVIGFSDENGKIFHQETAYWLPDSGLMRFKGQVGDPWWKLRPEQQAVYQKVATGLEAFTPSLSSVKVKGKTAADPNSYMRLLGKFRYAVLGKAKLHLVRIKLTAAGENPWVDGTVVLSYDAKQRLLIRPDGYFRLPAALGKLVLARASLNTKASGSGGGNSVLAAGLGIGAVAAFGVLGLTKLRKMT